MYSTDYTKLVGQKIMSHKLCPDGTYLYLYLENGSRVHFDPEGDCCSYSWIESIDDPTVLKGEILSIENIDMPDLGNIGTSKKSQVEEIQYYGLKIKTTNGISVIDFRNSSNGYYGGWLNLIWE